MEPLQRFERGLKRVLTVSKREEISGAIVLRVDLSALRLNFQPRTPFLLLKSGASDPSAERILARAAELRLAQRWCEQPCVLVTDARLPPEALPGKGLLLIVLDGTDLEALATGTELTNLLPTRAREQLSRSVLSPYETSRPVTGARFFNRDTERRQLLTRPGTNFVVMGMRRVGKTSLIQEVERQMRADREYGAIARPSAEAVPWRPAPEQPVPVVLLDCSPYPSTEQVLRNIVVRLNPRLDKRFDPEEYVRYLRQLSYNGHQRVQVLLDEVDPFITLDRQDGWRALTAIRASANEGYARYIFAGQEQLLSGLVVKDAPLFNFATPMVLAAFSSAIARELVQLPMERLGIHIDADLVNQVVHETGGHPNILQFFCQSFVDQLDEDGRDEVQPADFQKVMDEPSFSTFVLRTFAENTSIVEKLVVLASLPEDAFTVMTLSEVLHRRRVFLRDVALQQALDGLTYGGILARSAAEYRLKLPVLKTLLACHYDLGYLINQVRIEMPEALVRGGGA